MQDSIFWGPQFTIESKTAVIILGHSERREVGQLWLEALDRRKIFEDVDLITLNRAAAMMGRASLRQHLKRSTVFTHSASITRVEAAQQVIAINPPEPVDGLIELVRRAMEIGKDPIVAEEGAHKTGALDLIKAAIELLRSPASTIATMHKIGRGAYSTVRELSERASDFPAGRAIVHSENDGFGFRDSADVLAAANAGITTGIVHVYGGAFHNSILFSPDRMMSQLAPKILPE